MENLHFSQTRLLDGFWNHYAQLNRKVTVPSVYDRFSETGRFDALRCDWKPDMPNKPHIFWDSDVAKWMEAVAYLTETQREPELEALVDKAVDEILRNQKPSGYFNSYYITMEPDVEFQKRGNHELYCAGHLIEAAVAYDKATGKNKFLKAMIRYADYIYQVFVVEKRAAFVTPGHEEIELALLLLAEYTGIEKYQALAKFFIEERGRHLESSNPAYSQSDVPVREIREAKGHAVRACYLYTAMAMLAKQTEDRELLEVCKGIFHDITARKLSITGGIGAQISGESFGREYDLPNTDNYNETCAAIALTMFAGALQETEPNSQYADVIEQILYNGFLSGISLSGDAFFYDNVLEIDLRDYPPAAPQNDDMLYTNRYLKPHRLQRSKVFGCSCCPPNVNRMLASITRYMYTVDGNTIYCNQFMASRTELTVGGKPAVLELHTDYPCDGKLTFTYHGEPVTLAVRIPAWCAEYAGEPENGYAVFSVTDGKSVSLELPMKIHFVEANPRVRANAGRYAVTRGPLVYCMESVDNGEDLRNIEILDAAKVKITVSEEFHAPVINIDAVRRPKMTNLYQLRSTEREPFSARLIPYFAFANRGKTNMLIWTMVL